MDHLDPTLREIWLMVLEEIEQQRELVVTKTDFNELKEIVRDLATVQKRTEQRMEELATAQQRTEQRMEELATAQQRTEQRIGELAAAQQRTEQRMGELAAAQQRTEQQMGELAAQQHTEQRMEELADAQTPAQLEMAKLGREMQTTRSQIGGLAKTMAYALENEAYRQLPALLKTRAGLQFKERLIRTVIGGEEINFFAKAERDGQAVLVVGESVLKLDDVSKLKQVEQHVELVRQTLSEPLIPLIVTHFAHPLVLEKACMKGIIVVQSFEWEVL